ncbi:2-amino-4-hydroxy-6-hydroxymethyldihydropteridine diphosphokinase [bacterium]|nr:2-amino-4-hydroxy-6-hydroxymethyldihydropteridine diphosphokinase [bacterium]
MSYDHSAIVHLALGSNQGNRREHLQKACHLIEERLGECRAISQIYETEPLSTPHSSEQERATQQNFFNIALSLETKLPPILLLRKILDIESELGRDRAKEGHWGARPIDIDLIACGEQSLHSEELTLPHPRYRERDFVLLPLREITPEFTDPEDGTPITAMIASPQMLHTFIRTHPFELY